MTLADLEAMDSNTLTVKQVAEFLSKDPQVIRDQAEREPKYLGFPICKAGHSYCIPRLGFIAWVKGETPMLTLQYENIGFIPKNAVGGRVMRID